MRGTNRSKKSLTLSGKIPKWIPKKLSKSRKKKSKTPKISKKIQKLPKSRKKNRKSPKISKKNQKFPKSIKNSHKPEKKIKNYKNHRQKFRFYVLAYVDNWLTLSRRPFQRSKYDIEVKDRMKYKILVSISPYRYMVDALKSDRKHFFRCQKRFNIKL